MKLGFYPGCSLKGSAREYNESVSAVAQAAGIELREVPDWNCCGATAAHNLNHDLSLALPARILAKAEKEKMAEVVAPCAACYNRLCMTRHELLEDSALRKKISDVLEMEYQGTTKVVNVIEMLQYAMKDGLASKFTKEFPYKVACYYGCLLIRPPKIIQFDRPEDPQSMDEIMRKIGATPIDWAFKMECCGAGFSISRTETVIRLSSLIIEDAVSRGAEAIIVGCPMCHVNLDMRRPLINKYTGKNYDIPVIYVTQAVGIALGIPWANLGLHRHKVPVKLPSPGAPAQNSPNPQNSEPENENVEQRKE